MLGLFSGIVIAALTYLLTKWREREAELRKEKLAYYKFYIESLSGVLEGEQTSEGLRLYAKATNNLLLFAPQSVIRALNAYRSETSISNENRSRAAHDKLFSELMLAIRKDVGVRPIDDPTSSFVLWTSGAPNKAA